MYGGRSARTYVSECFEMTLLLFRPISDNTKNKSNISKNNYRENIKVTWYIMGKGNHVWKLLEGWKRRKEAVPRLSPRLAR